MKVKGLDKVLAKLNKVNANISNDLEVGLLKAASLVSMKSQKKIPHDKGVLISSVFVAQEGFTARVGYTAKYAPYVHEMPTTYNFSKSGTGPKFLINAAFGNENAIIRIIRNEAKI